MKARVLHFLAVCIALSIMACSASESESDSSGGGDSPTDATTDSSDSSTDVEDDVLVGNWPAEEWLVDLPESQNIDGAKLDELRSYSFADGRNTQSVVVIRNGVIVGEWYADGHDMNDHVTSWSVGKSFLSAVVGIAMERGDLASVDDPVVNYFPEWEGTGRDAITLRHALQMRSGLAPSTDDIYMQADQMTHSLNREVLVDPGTSWAYQNEDSMLVTGAIERATGKPLAEYAKEVLFDPLGMDALWWTDYMGNTLGYCCIDATARDFARFGLLFARSGQWKDTQLIPQTWYDESVVSSHTDMTYGLHWWTFDSRFHGANFAAIGYMNQLIWVFPQYDLVILRNGLYIRHGTEPRVEWESYHETLPASDWDDLTFIGLALDAILDE